MSGTTGWKRKARSPAPPPDESDSEAETIILPQNDTRLHKKTSPTKRKFLSHVESKLVPAIPSEQRWY